MAVKRFDDLYFMKQIVSSSHLCNICRTIFINRNYHEYDKADKKETEAYHIRLALLWQECSQWLPYLLSTSQQFGSEYWDYLRGVALTCTKEQKKQSSIKFDFGFWAPRYGLLRVEVTAKFRFPNTKHVDRQWYNLYLIPVNCRSIPAFSHPIVSDIQCRG